jgi:membrane protein implicated in regulation of membrane protease activity
VDTWLLLAIAGVVFVILEIFTPSFVMAPAGVAFLLTAAVSPFLPNLAANLGALALNLVVVYWGVQRYVWPRLAKTAPRTAASGMVGQVATVVEPIRPDGSGGYVKLYGDSWRAVGKEAFEVGERVTIVATEGNKVIVARLE